MAGFYNLDHKEVIRVKVKKCDGRMQPEYKKFSIDPQITSYEMLQGILARAFEIKTDFTISYLARDSEGQTVYLTMLSDWDMDAAFQCAADPCLKLKVDLRPFEEELEDWDVIAPAEIPQARISNLLDKGSILGAITHNLGKTMTSMQRAMGFKQENEAVKPLKPPMSDMEFKNYLDSAGYMLRPNEFRLAIYQGGIEPSLRRVAWRHLLNIFPANMSGKDRFDYMKRKEEEYRKLREEWREKFKTNTATEEVKYVASMVKKDVLRTDRAQGFFAGDDDNENTLALFHLLVTYALTHPDVSYCQGMSDLASPLLVTQKDEGQAYICFCALMERMRENFTLEGTAIMTKFRHLSELLAMYDPILHTYLEQNSAGDLFFCYRWLLLELKREFPFSDALYVLEVMWATLPPSPPEKELLLVDRDYSCRLLSTSPCSPTFSFQQAMYAKLLAMRRVGALHRVAQASMAIARPTDQASNNNLSLASCSSGLGHTGGSNMTASYDTSPGDPEDRGSDFPEVDQVLTRSLQKKSDSIDHILKEGSSTDSDQDEVEETTDTTSSIGDEKMTNGGGDYSPGILDAENSVRSTVVPDTVSDYGSADMSHDVNSFPAEECSDFHFSASNEDYVNNERSYSISSVVSESSESSEQQIQFALSLETNSVSDPVKETPNQTLSRPEPSNVIYTKAPVENTDTDSNKGLFQSMKRLLSSPIRRSNTQNSSEGASSPPHSPNKGMNQSYAPSAPALTALAGGDQSSPLTKNFSESHLSDCKEATESLDSSASSLQSSAKTPLIRDPGRLPPPQDFGSGNPFLMFVCFTLLMMHRDTIIRNNMCYEDIAMHFDRLVRRHNAERVLHQARQMYTEYLKAQQVMVEKQKEEAELGMSC